MKTLLARFASSHDETGAAAVEFALVLPILLLIVFGIFAFGQFYSEYQILQGAAREGARHAAVRATPDEIRAAVRNHADPIVLSATPSVIVEGGGDQCDDTTAGEQVTVRWNQDFEINMPFVPVIDTSVEMKGVFRCE
jgi:Flp pilus assembly protein TadG